MILLTVPSTLPEFQGRVRPFAFGGLEIYDAALRAKAEKAFAPAAKVVTRYFISIRREVPENAPLSFQDELGALANKWTTEFERVGGLAGLIGTSKRPSGGKK